MSYLAILRARIVALTESGFPPVRVKLSADHWAQIQASHRSTYGGDHQLNGRDVLGVPVDIRAGGTGCVIVWSGGAEEVLPPTNPTSPD